MKLYAGYSGGITGYSALVTFLDGNPVWYRSKALSEPALSAYKIINFPEQIPALRALLIIGPKAFWETADKEDV